jgi:hypothetical protein
VHHVRHPLVAIQAIFDDHVPAAFGTASQVSDSQDTLDVLLASRMQTYVIENQMIEMVADSRYRAEDVSLVELCGFGPVDLSSEMACKNMPLLPPRVGFRGPRDGRGAARSQLTWAKLLEVDPAFGKQTIELARRYGYTVLLEADMNEPLAV